MRKMSSSFITQTLWFMVFLFFPINTFACEPLVPLAMLYGMPYFSLFGIVILKGAIFAWLEKSMVWYKAVFYIILANIVSSLIGLCLTISTTAPTILIIFLPIIFFVSRIPAKRFIRYNPWDAFKIWTPTMLAILITGLYFITFVLFGFSQEVILQSSVLYWIVKYCFVVIALMVSICLTTLWEEWVVSKLGRGVYLMNILKVNLVAFFIAMAVLAAIALPKRLNSVDFLI